MLCSLFIFTNELYTYTTGRIDWMSVHWKLSDRFKLLLLYSPCLIFSVAYRIEWRSNCKRMIEKFFECNWQMKWRYNWEDETVMSSFASFYIDECHYRRKLRDTHVSKRIMAKNNEKKGSIVDRTSGMIIREEFMQKHWLFARPNMPA